MINPTELRAQVADWLRADLGTYAIGGSLLPAIALLPDPDYGYAYPPETIKIAGLECKIIQPMNGWVGLMGNSGMMPKRWEIRLLQWDSRHNLIEAGNRLVPLLARSLSVRVESPQLIPPQPSKGIVEQAVIRFTEYLAVV